MTLLDIKTIAAKQWKIEECHKGLKRQLGVKNERQKSKITKKS